MSCNRIIVVLITLWMAIAGAVSARAIPIPADGVLNTGDTGSYTTPVLGRNTTFIQTLEFLAAANRIEIEFSTASANGGSFRDLRFWFRDLTANRWIANNVSVLVGPRSFLFNLIPGRNYQIRILAQTANTGGRNAQNHATVNVVSTVPVPPAVWLLATGLLGIGVMSRRRSSVRKSLI
jgi:hypothetical protein